MEDKPSVNPVLQGSFKMFEILSKSCRILEGC